MWLEESLLPKWMWEWRNWENFFSKKTPIEHERSRRDRPRPFSTFPRPNFFTPITPPHQPSSDLLFTGGAYDLKCTREAPETGSVYGSKMGSGKARDRWNVGKRRREILFLVQPAEREVEYSSMIWKVSWKHRFCLDFGFTHLQSLCVTSIMPKRIKDSCTTQVSRSPLFIPKPCSFPKKNPFPLH